MMQLLSIIIPSYNESNYLPKLINKIKSVKLDKKKFTLEIIVVDDGSTDNTQEVLSKIKDIKVIHQKNRGKGSAVQKGIEHSLGDYILIQDADLEYDPNDYPKLLEPIFGQEKIAIFGSRPKKINNTNSFFKDKHIKQGYAPYFMNKLLCFLFQVLYKIKLTDPLTGYKIYDKKFFQEHNIISNGFEADHEITLKLIKSDYKIIDIPINYNPRSKQEGKKINYIDGIKAIITLLKFYK